MKMDYNTCDKCKIEIPSIELIWITTEDFKPKEGEIVPEELYNKYDALCEDCYLEEIIKIEFTEDHIRIYEGEKEIVGWVQTEWEEDSNVVFSIVNAVMLACIDIQKLKKILKK